MSAHIKAAPPPTLPGLSSSMPSGPKPPRCQHRATPNQSENPCHSRRARPSLQRRRRTQLRKRRPQQNPVSASPRQHSRGTSSHRRGFPQVVQTDPRQPWRTPRQSGRASNMRSTRRRKLHQRTMPARIVASWPCLRRAPPRYTEVRSENRPLHPRLQPGETRPRSSSQHRSAEVDPHTMSSHPTLAGRWDRSAHRRSRCTQKRPRRRDPEVRPSACRRTCSTRRPSGSGAPSCSA
mmetsp:Transcript_61556/g.200883  ORF Transcript_61556/g.200883 Transcript_61556/m.200883 type:complete len:236 (-) Transcript_61556:522-1229(-)